MTHPAVLHALATVWSVRAALHWRPDYREARAIQRPQPPAAGRARIRSLGELHAYDVLLREERADRATQYSAGLKPTAATSAPADLDLVDLERELEQTLTDVVDLVDYANRQHPLLRLSPVWRTIIEDLGVRPGGSWRWSYLVAALPGTPPAICDQVVEFLGGVDTELRANMGLRPDTMPLPGAPRCPTCRERRLRVQISAPNSARWTIVCGNSACACLGEGGVRAGDGCPCTMPVRARGYEHIWDANSDLAAAARAGIEVVPPATMAA